MRRLPSKSRRLLSLTAALALAACGGDGETPPPTPDAGPTLDPVPARGQAATLDVGSWNIEWFGDLANGPKSESQQQENVRAVLAGVGLDLWGVEEVVDTVKFQRTVNLVPGYATVLVSDPNVTGRSLYSTGEQKVGLVYRTDEVQLVSAAVILGDLGSTGGPFAGRPPLEVKLRVSPGGAPAQDLVVIVVHMKAFDDETSYSRRAAASAALKDYLDANHATTKVAVIGDFNDDVDTSITAGKASPYANFVQDSADYTFVTGVLSAAGGASTTSHPEVIDHHLTTNELAATLVPGSVEILKLEGSIADYANSTSDHYPVISRYTP